MCKKRTNAILDANGGLHHPRALKKAHEILLKHGYKNPILLHFVLSGSQSVEVYRDTYKEIAEHFRNHRFPVEYFGCLDATHEGGLHAHIFFIVETVKRFPWNTLNANDGEFLHKLANRRRINRIHISKPKNKVHRPTPWEPVFFARPVAKDGKLEDCMQWITDEYKNKSKEGIPGEEIYFFSEFKANTAKPAAKKKPVPVASSPSSEAAETDSVNVVFPSPIVGSRSRGRPSFLRAHRATSDAPPAHPSLASRATTGS